MCSSKKDLESALEAQEDTMNETVVVQNGRAKRLLSACLWVFKRSGLDEVILHSYPKAIFTWPLWLLGFVLALSAGTDGSVLIGWVYLIALMVVLLTLCFDVDRNLAVFWAVLVFAVFFTAMWLRDVKGLLLVNSFGSWVSHWDPGYSRNFGLGVSWILTMIYVVVFIQTRLSNRWRVTRNEVEKIAFGHRDSSIGRGAKCVQSSYPDVFELLLLGAGKIEIRSASGNKLMATIEHVPFLFWRMRKIGPLLESLSVSPGGTDVDEGADEHHEEEAVAGG